MNLNFNEQYKDYPTIELLKILKRPGDYQPEAIDAARHILQGRDVAAGDEQEADEYLAQTEEAEQQRKEKINAYREKAVDFLEPVLQPGNKVDPVKWLNLFLFIVALQFIYTLYQDVRQLIRIGFFVAECRKYGVTVPSGGRVYGFWGCLSNGVMGSTLLDLLELAYMPWIFYLLLKRRRWGWILLFANRAFVFISLLGQSYIFFKYQALHHGSISAFVTGFLISAAFVYFLWRNDISGFFGVTAKTKKETLAISISGSLLLIVGAASL